MAESVGFRSFSNSASTVCSPNSTNPSKPVPMKLFSTWEVEKSTPSCIPRVCCLTLTRLQVLKSLESDLQSVLIAIKMQSSKQVLRSNEITLSSHGLLDTQLDLTFSLQYPHFLKRDGNRLQIMLQRRKKYKNRAMLGYKTLAAGHINMSQVLQKAVDQELYLYSDLKESSHRVAMVMIMAMSSQPIDQDEHRAVRSTDPDRSPGELSEEDDVREYQDFSSNDENSDVDPLPGDDEWTSRFRKLRAMRPAFALRQRNLKQKFIALLRRFKVSEEVLESVQDLGDRNDNQYVEDLFDEVENLSDSDVDMDTMSVHSTPKPKLTPFFSNRGGGSRSNLVDIPSHLPAVDLDKSSEDGSWIKAELDNNMSRSTRDKEIGLSDVTGAHYVISKSPALKPVTRRSSPSPLLKHRRFQRHKSSSLRERKRSLDHPAAAFSEWKEQERRSSLGCLEIGQPRRLLMDQLTSIFNSNKPMPECLVLVNTHEWQSQMVAQALQNAGFQTVCTCSAVDVRATVAAIVNKIQKHTSKSLGTTAPVKIAIVGGDGYVSSVLRPYVELFSSKTPDWLNYMRFLVIPFGISTLAKNLSRLDSRYNSLFNDTFWKESVVEKLDSLSRFDVAEVASRIVRFLSGANHVVQLPLAEAIITNKEKGTDESSQIIVPFVADVRLGLIDVCNSSVLSCPNEAEEVSLLPALLSSSPPGNAAMFNAEKTKEFPTTHPINLSSSLTSTLASGMPSSAVSSHSSTAIITAPDTVSSESVDLQVEYWLAGPRIEHTSEKTDRPTRKEVKCSLKTAFRSVQVFRPHCALSPSNQATGPSEVAVSNCLSMIIVTREKKQKIMRLKRPKDPDTKKSQQIDGISRLICTSKTQNTVLSVSIDGVDWPAVKFFQLSAQWQTHVKHFPVLLSGMAAVTTLPETLPAHFL